MTTIVGRNLSIHVATAFGSAIAVTGVSLANPGVATKTAHGLTAGACGHWTITAGMEELHEQGSRVSGVTSDTFEIQGIDTREYTAWSAGTFTPATSWALLTDAAGLEVGGGAATLLDDTRLHDRKTRNVSGLLGAQNLTISTKPQTTNGQAMAFIENGARQMWNILFRITMPDESVWVAYGMPSLPGASVQSGQLASGSFTVTVPQWVAKGAA